MKRIIGLANNKAHDYSVSDYLPHNYVFYTETDDETTLVEICDTDLWNRIVHIEKPINEKFNDNDIFKLIELCEKVIEKEEIKGV